MFIISLCSSLPERWSRVGYPMKLSSSKRFVSPQSALSPSKSFVSRKKLFASKRLVSPTKRLSYLFRIFPPHFPARSHTDLDCKRHDDNKNEFYFARHTKNSWRKWQKRKIDCYLITSCVKTSTPAIKILSPAAIPSIWKLTTRLTRIMDFFVRSSRLNVSLRRLWHKRRSKRFN